MLECRAHTWPLLAVSDMHKTLGEQVGPPRPPTPTPWTLSCNVGGLWWWALKPRLQAWVELPQVQIQAYLVLLHFVLLHLAICVFYKLKVCGNPMSSKSIRTVFLTAFAYFMSLCRFLILPIFQTLSLLSYLLWWSVISNLSLFFFWLCCGAHGILFPWPGIKPVPPAVEAWSPNH